MTHIRVLGPGCKNCTETMRLLQEAIEELELDATIEKESDVATILKYGALSTPGVVIDEKLVHSGSVPSPEEIRSWLQAH